MGLSSFVDYPALDPALILRANPLLCWNNSYVSAEDPIDHTDPTDLRIMRTLTSPTNSNKSYELLRILQASLSENRSCIYSGLTSYQIDSFLRFVHSFSNSINSILRISYYYLVMFSIPSNLGSHQRPGDCCSTFCLSSPSLLVGKALLKMFVLGHTIP
jgi:hypothetical protein